MNPKAAIVGAGLIGGSWAIVFARAGFDVALFDAVAGAADRTHAQLRPQLEQLARAGLLAETVEAIADRVHVAPDLGAALDGAGYVQESVLERIDVKRAVFSQIDEALGPDALVGSSSSGIPASQYADHVRFRDRCLVVHPVNPPHLIPVVELVPAPWTAPETVAAVRTLMERVGQAPVELTREVEGFLVNRLQGALLMEAWRLVEAGLATVEDVDRTVSQGLGLRWAFMGPFETIDLNAPGGVADYARRLGPLYQSLAASVGEARVWDAALTSHVEAQRREVLAAAQLEPRRAWRDRRLMALALHKRQMAQDDEAAQGSAVRPSPEGPVR